MHENASERRGTHMTKNRALGQGSGKKPWKQKGTGRARVGEIRNPLWRKGGTVFGPQPRSYAFALPKKVERGALRAALAAKMRDGARVVDALRLDAQDQGGRGDAEAPRRHAARRCVIDVKPDEQLRAVGAQHRRRVARAEQPRLRRAT